MIIVSIILSTLLVNICLLGDNYVEVIQIPLLKAIADNATHAAIGALTGIAYALQLYERMSNRYALFLVLSCLICASLIDVDHFIVAHSWCLQDATNLTNRPFLHCSSIILIFLAIYIYMASLNYIKYSLFLGIIICAFATHHTRDAVRRGYWFYPIGHTNKLSNNIYIFITIVTPYILSYVFNICRSTTIQNKIAHYMNSNEKFDYDYVQV